MTAQPSLKCRARRRDNGEWIYGWYVCLTGRVGNPEKHKILKVKPLPLENLLWTIDPDTLQVFTGRCDKNGDEIYGGMWLRALDGRPCLVKWDNAIAGWVCSADGIRIDPTRWSKREIIPDDKENEDG